MAPGDCLLLHIIVIVRKRYKKTIIAVDSKEIFHQLPTEIQNLLMILIFYNFLSFLNCLSLIIFDNFFLLCETYKNIARGTTGPDIASII